jgi:NAD-dependent deacetylase
VDDKIILLRKMIEESGKIVFFGGAGVSTESGIPDFRGADGLYGQKYRVPPETILSRSFFINCPEEFFAFYREKMICPHARPNEAHKRLVLLEERGKLQTIVTQNIDGLHQAAGARNVLELHGSVYRNYCMKCRKTYGVDFVLKSAGVPRCDCGGIVRPDVVLYEEGLDEETVGKAVRAISDADMLIIGGTSLSVYPAAGLIRYYSGRRLVLINKTPTPYDQEADLHIAGSVGQTLAEAVE